MIICFISLLLSLQISFILSLPELSLSLPELSLSLPEFSLSLPELSRAVFLISLKVN